VSLALFPGEWNFTLDPDNMGVILHRDIFCICVLVSWLATLDLCSCVLFLGAIGSTRETNSINQDTEKNVFHAQLFLVLW